MIQNAKEIPYGGSVVENFNKLIKIQIPQLSSKLVVERHNKNFKQIFKLWTLSCAHQSLTTVMSLIVRE